MSTNTAIVPIDILQRYADTFAKSAMFGAKTPEQAMSLLLLAQAEGVHPAIAMRDFDVIQGRPAKKAQAMHRSFLEAGGKIEWHERTDTKADATFSHPQGGQVRVAWDMERARKAGLSGKDMYAKYPRQMLAARAISEGCRTVYPAATSGLYVPEEFNDKFAPPEKNMGAADVVEEHDITQEIPGVGNAAPQASPPSPTTPAGSAFISEEQMVELDRMFAECDEKAKAAFLKQAVKLGVDSLEKLPAADYSEAVEWIERRKAKKGAA
jgi:hypothetical protein